MDEKKGPISRKTRHSGRVLVADIERNVAIARGDRVAFGVELDLLRLRTRQERYENDGCRNRLCAGQQSSP
jgi:hypothetical protein